MSGRAKIKGGGGTSPPPAFESFNPFDSWVSPDARPWIVGRAMGCCTSREKDDDGMEKQGSIRELPVADDDGEAGAEAGASDLERAAAHKSLLREQARRQAEEETPDEARAMAQLM